MARKRGGWAGARVVLLACVVGALVVVLAGCLRHDETSPVNPCPSELQPPCVCPDGWVVDCGEPCSVEGEHCADPHPFGGGRSCQDGRWRCVMPVGGP